MDGTPVGIDVIIPVFNEERNIISLFDRLKNVLEKLNVDYRCIFVDDGSTDTSSEIIRRLALESPQVKFISLSRNFGQQVAITAGLNFSKASRTVIIDADLQDPPEVIAELNSKMNEGWDVVYARRRARKGESFFKRWTASILYRLLARLASIKIPVDTGDFRMLNRKVVSALNQMPERHKFIRGMISWVGFRQTFVEYDRDQRYAGQTGYTFRRMVRFAVDGVTGFSNVPLKLATVAGFLISGFSFVLILWALYARYITKNYVQGWTSIMISILFIGGIQLICLGVIGEYLIRMDANIRQRPLYIVNDTNLQESQG